MADERDSTRTPEQRVPSPKYRERYRREMLDDPEVKEEIEQFDRFLKERGVRKSH